MKISNKKLETRKLENIKGITLVALVVTIVVLLILAGITINMLFSDKGIIKKAQEAENAWKNAEQIDQQGLQNLADQLEQYTNGLNGGGTTFKEITDSSFTNIQTSTEKAKDVKGNIVTIPKGFKVVTSEGTTVQDGIVIEDKDGNQFVWIPIGTVTKNDGTKSNNIQLGRYTFSTIDGTPTLEQAAYTEVNPTNYTKEVVINSLYKELSTFREGVASEGLDGLNGTAKGLAGFVSSVKTNGGYYIARYEASYSSGTSNSDYLPQFKVSTTNSENSMNYTKGTLWNFITELDASKVCRNLYKADSSVGVESDLVNSYAWDTAIIYIQEMGNANYANKTSPNVILKNTGETGDKVCNIFDMAGNEAEWTTEYSTYKYNTSTSPCVGKGGFYSSDLFCTARSDMYSSTYIHNVVSFRGTLYIK